MKQVYLNINNDLINDIFNLDDPDEFAIDQSLLDMVEGNSSKKKKSKDKEKAPKKEKKKDKEKEVKKKRIMKIRRK